ncbi:hypothetical protein KP003_04055 [Geomonas nitrogeniifigens]|uniref:Lipoprotein n=1 Tax=Geomonas diazotrophica TaxID=2843197 RepID=A0ABX8JJ48_9BACT|nr:hypothetical protein [Geomonas nitrogeniifigens]QWV98405.1 hypothetical protein KP005_03695 [Geomonas nitrogeniifigens]QXE87587.1 hypothetical protein KP003_04055 [Geomonas nitrogeniifigens]
MKAAVVLLTLLLALPAYALDKDKISHFGGGAILGLASDTVLYHATDLERPKRMIAATGLAMIPGFAIEVADEFTGTHFSWYDLLADGLGSATGMLAGELINGRLWVKASARQVQLTGRW